MIELIDPHRCTSCNLCIRVCPTDVFERVNGGVPQIARQDVCQTCFLCEIHCPEDAMYVAPLRAPAPAGTVHLDADQLRRRGYFGSYRARLGWGEGLNPPHSQDELLALAAAGPRLLDQPESPVKPQVLA